MKLMMFSLFDAAAEAYMQPFFAQTRGQAIRSFGDLVNEVGSHVNKHPDDYTLFVVGVFDQQSGEVVHQTPVSLGNALEYVSRERRLEVS